MPTSLIIRFFFTSLCLSLLIYSQSFSQTKENFEKIFLKETESKYSESQSQQFRNIKQLSYFPDTLPNWFFTPPRSTEKVIYSLGISDPDLTPEEAAEQALYRAKTMAILSNKARIQFFRDVYTTEFTEGKQTYFGQRFDTYFKISGSGFTDFNSFEVIGQHLTRYNEAIVLIRFSPANLSQTNFISTEGTALYIEAQIGEAFEPQAEFEFNSLVKTENQPDKTAHFTFRKRGNRFLSISEFLGENHEFPLFTYKYSNPSWPANTQPLVSYNGLWSIYAKKLMRQLTLETEQSSVRIKSLDEQYNPELRNLSREVAIIIAQMFINGIEFGTDSIGFDIQLRKLNQIAD